MIAYILMKNLKIIFERAKGNYSAYCLGLPGCVATGRTFKEVKKNMRKAIKMHTEKEIKLKLGGKIHTLKCWRIGQELKTAIDEGLSRPRGRDRKPLASTSAVKIPSGVDNICRALENLSQRYQKIHLLKWKWILKEKGGIDGRRNFKNIKGK